MDAQLKRTLESIEKNGIIKAEYPVGTRTYEQSHFLLLDIYSPWEKAYKFASDHKAHLAVPSSPAENQWLISAYSDEEKPMTFWLGGHQLDPSSPWQWITKEVWHSSGWQPDQPGEDSSKNRMSMSLTDTSSSDFKNWVSSNGKDAQATAILLEWSDPEPVNTAAGEFDLAPWLASVNAKIVQRVKPDVDGYEKEYDQLVSQHVRSMKREAKKGMQADKVGDGGRSWNIRRVGRFIDSLDKIEQADQISQVLPRFAPKRLKEIQANSATALKELSDAHEAKLLVHLEFYTKGLIGKATELEGSGFVQQARTLQNTVEKIGTDTDAFVKTLGM
jgi:hypothetical protein